MQKKIMICGASGFIGRNLFEYFNSLREYDTYGTYFRNEPTFQAHKFFKVDLKNKEETLWATRDMDIVINAAGQITGIGVFSVEESGRANAEANGLINSNLIEAAHINKVKHFVFLSCTIMYPSSDVPLAENGIDINRIHPTYVRSGEMKISGEERCRDFANLGSTKYTVVRHTNIYGPHDKFDLQRGHVLASTIVKVAQAENEITIWGQGTETRDFLYIEDQIDFIQKAIEFQKNNFEIFNVGFGKSYTIIELVENIILRFSKKIIVRRDTGKPTIGSRINIDSGKALRVLGWKAHTELNEGLKKTIEWYKNNYPQ
jgi:GDP-L-fucose synthase